ncbi:MAG: hypothetical protein U1E35_01350 [Rhodospirillales bacterium]
MAELAGALPDAVDVVSFQPTPRDVQIVAVAWKIEARRRQVSAALQIKKRKYVEVQMQQIADADHRAQLGKDGQECIPVAGLSPSRTPDA